MCVCTLICVFLVCHCKFSQKSIFIRIHVGYIMVRNYCIKVVNYVYQVNITWGCHSNPVMELHVKKRSELYIISYVLWRIIGGGCDKSFHYYLTFCPEKSVNFTYLLTFERINLKLSQFYVGIVIFK